MNVMRWWRWWRRDDESRGDPNAARAELLSTYLDGEATCAEAAELERELTADPALRAELGELGALRDALSELGELRAPRPFTFETTPERVRGGLGRLELATRAGVVVAAVTFAVVLTGDLVDLGGGDNATPLRESAVRSGAPDATLTQAAAEDDDTGAAEVLTATARRGEPRKTEDAIAEPMPLTAGMGATTTAPEAAAALPMKPPQPSPTAEATVVVSAEDDEYAPEVDESASEVALAYAEEGPVELARAVNAETDNGVLRVAEFGLLAAVVVLAVLAIGQWLARRHGQPVA